MRRSLAVFIGAIVTLSSVSVFAQSASPFHRLDFQENRQFVVHCAAGYECDIQLEAGERVNDGFNAHMEDWEPHIGYSGVDKVTPHLILRPTTANLRTNIILTTTKRTYYLLAISTNRSQPSYYSFAFTDETFRELTRISHVTQAALRAAGAAPQPYVTATPSNVARLASTCIDYDYSYVVDRSLQNDRPPHARPSTERLPKSLEPRVVCTDGTHTYVEFPRQQEAPADLPISLAVTTEGDTLIDYTYVATLNRFTIDGVYDSFALEVGSQDQPLRIRIYHGNRGNPPTQPKPIRIAPPADVQEIDRPIVPMQTPLISTVATAMPVEPYRTPSDISTPTSSPSLTPPSARAPSPASTPTTAPAAASLTSEGVVVSLKITGPTGSGGVTDLVTWLDPSADLAIRPEPSEAPIAVVIISPVVASKARVRPPFVTPALLTRRNP